MTKARGNFLKGFAVGVGLIVFSNAVPIITQGAPVPQHIGAWLDLAVEAALAGLLLGSGAAWMGRERKKPTN